MDKILDDFEQEQLEESKNPRPKKVVKKPGSRPRQRKQVVHEDDDEEAYPIELETTRSGKFLAIVFLNHVT